MDYFSFDEAIGLDLGWWAIDAQNHIGFFTSGGDAPVSSKLTITGHKQMWNYFFKESPVISKVIESKGWQILSNFDNCCNGYTPDKSISLEERISYFLSEYLIMGTKGVFGFSASPGFTNYSTYYRITIPENPLLFNNLPSDIQSSLHNIKIFCDFSEVTEIQGNCIPEPLEPIGDVREF
ncbi:MAG: hypothetical protein LBC74_12970 [Planctomycetaceae bacterium]|jgi:hypothetical protein|nr:hypothetical protein [Planctomycetaceae bacterium]